jgi:hypothetical protein
MARRALRIAGSILLLAIIAVGVFTAWRLYDRDTGIRAADAKPTPELIARGK